MNSVAAHIQYLIQSWVDCEFPGVISATIEAEDISFLELKRRVRTRKEEEESPDTVVLKYDSVLLHHVIPTLAHFFLFNLPPSNQIHFKEHIHFQMVPINLPQSMHCSKIIRVPMDGSFRSFSGQVVERGNSFLYLVEWEPKDRDRGMSRLFVFAKDQSLTGWQLGEGVMVIGKMGAEGQFWLSHIKKRPRIFPAIAVAPMLEEPINLGGPVATALVLSAIACQSIISPVHVLLYGSVMGDLGEGSVRLIMKCVGNSVTCANPKEIFPTVRRNASFGSALTLATDGLLMLNDVSLLTAKMSERLSDTMNRQCPTTVIGLWPTKTLTRDSDKPALVELRPKFPGLLMCFGLVFRVTDGKFQTFSLDTMRTRIAHASAIIQRDEMDISREATQLLEGFILASRKIRNIHSQELSISAFSVGISLAKAHAALHNRLSVWSIDAVVAIWLLEESLVCSTGRSVINFSRHVPGGKTRGNLSMYNKGLIDLEEHLKRFILEY